jgi:hypothetical protein
VCGCGRPAGRPQAAQRLFVIVAAIETAGIEDAAQKAEVEEKAVYECADDGVEHGLIPSDNC